MPLSDHFIHTCTIQRPSGTAVDAYNNAKAYYVTVATGVPCRLVEKAQRRLTDERTEDLVQTQYTLMLGPSTDAQERDRVVFDGRTFTIAALLKRNARSLHHVSARLEIVE